MERYENHLVERDNSENGVTVPSCNSSRSRHEFRARGGKVLARVAAVAAARNGSSASTFDMAVTRNVKKKPKRKDLQELFTTDYIVNTGPPLALDFDVLPSGAFQMIYSYSSF